MSAVDRDVERGRRRQDAQHPAPVRQRLDGADESGEPGEPGDHAEAMIRATMPYVSSPGRALAGPITQSAGPPAASTNDSSSSSQTRLIPDSRDSRSRSGS